MYFSECPHSKFKDFFSGHRKIAKKEIEHYEDGKEQTENRKIEYGCSCSGSLVIDGEKFKINLSKVDEIHEPFLPDDARSATCYGLIGGKDIEKIKELLQPIKVEEDK